MAELPPPTLIIRHIGELLTMAGPDYSQKRLGIIRDAAIVVRDEHILFVGTETALSDVSFANTDGPPPITIDAGGRLVTPGLIDAHTHLVFAGDRAGEFQQRHAGASYETIQSSGGGITSTVRATRAASDRDLRTSARERLLIMRAHGTTTVEAKTGYGLDRATEDRLLSIAASFAHEPGLPQVIATFLGAHVVPPEFHGDRASYVATICDEWLPTFAGRAAFCDVFCERGAFSAEESATILRAARRLGYHLKLHANQLSASGGATLAATLGAISADHLDHASDAELDHLAEAGVVGVLLPGCSFTLDTPYPDARRLLTHGLRVALATDLNPGTSYCESLQMMMSLAIAHMGMTIDEAFLAVTAHAADALALRDRGIIAPGMRADLAIWRATSHQEIGYHFGVNLVEHTIIGGVIAS